jgi:hypothetical protein
MNAQQRALSGPRVARDRDPAGAGVGVPVLIRVPALSASARRTTRRPAARRRRRLRREVRVAATALLCGLPMTWGLLSLSAGRPEAPVVAEARTSAEDESPTLSISLEPTGLTPTRDASPRVVLEEVIPDAGSEESAHAGG